MLSHGERARLVFLKMKLLRPNFYLLDEPTNHLDIEGQEDLEEQLERSDVSCLFVSHDRFFTRTAATRFLEIRKGRLVEIDDPDAFFEPSRGILGAMDLPLDDRLRIGVQTIHRRTEPAAGPWLPTIDEMRTLVELVDRSGYDSLWVGDHISFPIAILDPLLQLAQAAVVSRRLIFGTAVYLLPLRHPMPVAKQVATLDHLTRGPVHLRRRRGRRVPQGVRGLRRADQRARARASTKAIARAAQAVERRAGKPRGPLLRRLRRRADAAAAAPGRRPADLVRRPLGCRAAPRRAPGRRLDLLCRHAGDVHAGPREDRAGRERGRTRSTAASAPAHLLFTRLDDTYEKALDAATASLSQRYAMDFRKAAERYCALGPPQRAWQTASVRFHAAGVRHVILDLVGPYEERDRQIERFARDVLPLLAGLRKTPS